MQEDKKTIDVKKQLILGALAQTMKELRGNRSQFIIGAENDISTSIISIAERGKKDPQLTTIFKIAEAFDLSVVDFLAKVCEKLPAAFEMIDK